MFTDPIVVVEPPLVPTAPWRVHVNGEPFYRSSAPSLEEAIAEAERIAASARLWSSFAHLVA